MMGSLFFLFHGLAAALHGSVAAAGYNDFRSAFRAFIAFACLVCHKLLSLLKLNLF
jgi:hypothetical protein